MDERFDDLFDKNTAEPSQDEYDKEEYKEYKQQERQELFDMADAKLMEITADPAALNQYLAMQGRLGYSTLTTALLIMAQQPDATHIRDFEGWQHAGRAPRRGTGIKVFEANGEYQRDDGAMATSYTVKRVFDVSHTYGKPLPTRQKPPIRSLLKALTTDTPVPIRLSDTLNPDMVAEYSETDNAVYVVRDKPGHDLFVGIVKELAKAEGFESFHADCIANIVCARYWIPAKEIEEIPEWLNNLDGDGKKAALTLIRQAACDTMERVDGNLIAERQKQRTEQNREAR